MSKWNKPLGILVGKRPDARTFQEDPALPMSNKYIGIEIEAEKIPYNMADLNKLLLYWDIKPDGSLRNFGAEFVSKKLRGKDISLALAELESVLKNKNIVPEYSDRTSVHIHTDARFMTLEQLKSLIVYYLIHEPIIFSALGHGREDNNYCIPYYYNHSGLVNLAKLYTDLEKSSDILTVFAKAKKYEAMNVHSIQEKGSIEFRAHYGTHESAKIMSWVRLLLSLFKESKQYPCETFIEQFLGESYENLAFNFINKHGLSGYIDVSACEEKANISIGTLLTKAVNIYSLEKEIALHWPKTRKPEEKKNQPTTVDIESAVNGITGFQRFDFVQAIVDDLEEGETF